MRMAGAPHHTNPRSATLDFWRKTTPYEQYKIIQAKRRKQMNVPTSSGLNKEDHLGKITPRHEMLVIITFVTIIFGDLSLISYVGDWQ